jgi:hypothetical protein
MTTKRESKRILETSEGFYPCAECGAKAACEHGSPAFFEKPTAPKRGSKRILSVTVNRIADDDGDTSYLGKYSDEAGDFAIVNRGEHEGRFVEDLPCNCGHYKEDHKEVEDSYAPCTAKVGAFNDHTCNCEDFDRESVERGRSYRYFNPANIDTSIPDDEQRKYAQQDYQRMRGLNNDEWGFIGIKAVAKVALVDTGGMFLTQTIHSGGLWGIESDSEASYFDEVESEQLDELRSQLHAIGFSKRAITAAFRNVKRESE